MKANTKIKFPKDPRLVELMNVGIGGFYRIHVSESLTCGCGLDEPDYECDVGFALSRLSISAEAGHLDKHIEAA